MKTIFNEFLFGDSTKSKGRLISFWLLTALTITLVMLQFRSILF